MTDQKELEKDKATTPDTTTKPWSPFDINPEWSALATAQLNHLRFFEHPEIIKLLKLNK